MAAHGMAWKVDGISESDKMVMVDFVVLFREDLILMKVYIFLFV